MALSAGFLEELRARTPLASVVGRRVKLSRSGRNWRGCCPFHNEKTGSFYVYDDHFHCFGCGAHGDAVSFVMQSQGASFHEAVEQLAGEAGLEVPKESPAAAQQERRRLDLQAVLEAAASSYQRRLFLPEGARALDYLRGRGLTDDIIRRFAIGWSGEGRGQLAAELSRGGVAPAMLIEAGLIRPPDGDSRPAQDLFFNRIMFPIRDRRGRVLSFGGRVLGDGVPKYVNGPETALFSKRRTLFALDLAREAARNGAAVVLVEGYMDVVALHQAGFTAAVAPLGTALTEEQLHELWRLSPVPILCFDGDAAGRRAALRAADVALPHLTAERSLRFATLPDLDDPDTLVRRGGPSAFQPILESARRLSDALFDWLGEGCGSSPEQRAAFLQRLLGAAKRIQDRTLSDQYAKALKDRFYEAGRARKFLPAKRSGAAPARPPMVQRPVPSAAAAIAEGARNLLAILINHPALLHDVDEAFSGLELPQQWRALRTEMLAFCAGAEALDSVTLIDHLTQVGLATDVARALASKPYPLLACALPEAMPADAAAGWWHFFGLMHRGRLDEEVASAMRAMADQGNDMAAQQRLVALRTARNALAEGEHGAE
jgi:DNA primase